MKKGNKLMLGAMIASAMGISSCVDSSYDLDDVDMTIGSTVDLTIPTSSTGEILLKNIMDLEEDGIVQIVEGDYFLIEDGHANIDQVKISNIHMIAPPSQSFNASLNITDILTNVKGKKMAEGTGNLVYYPMKDMAKTNAFNTTSGIVSEDIVTIDDVKTEPFVVEVNVGTQDFPAFVTKSHLDGLTLTLPAGLHVTSCTFNGKEMLTTPEAIAKAKAGSIVLIDGEDAGRSANEQLQLKLQIEGVDVADDMACSFNNHKANISGQFGVEGYFRISESDIDMTQLTTQQQQDLFLSGGDLKSIMPEAINFNGKANFLSDIEVLSFNGTAQRKVGNISPIKLNNMPDFLNDEEVVLDLENPAIYIDVTNPMPLEAKTTISLTSQYDNASDIVRTTPTMTIPANQRTIFCLAESEQNLVNPYNGVTTVFVKVDDLGALLKRIPKQIKVDVADLTMDCYNMPVGKNYDLNVDYKVYTPVTFGDEFKMVYKGTENEFELGDDVQDLSAKDAKITISADAVNTLPVDCQLTVEALDKDGNKLNNILKPVSIKVNKKSTQKVSVSLEPTSGHNLDEVLHEGKYQLDGILYRAILDQPAAGETLNDKGYIKLTNIKLNIKGTVTYDAN